jgi:hypothetical protein
MMSLSLFVPKLLARHRYVSLMDALVEVCNKETHLHDTNLLQFATVLTAHSSVGRSSSARPAAPVLLASPLGVTPAAHDESVDLYYD